MFRDVPVVVGSLHQSAGACSVKHQEEQKERLRHHASQSRQKNGGVAVHGAMVEPFTERFLRCPKCNKWEEWYKWPGQHQCWWRVRFTARKVVILDTNSKKPCCETDCMVTTCRPPLILPTKTESIKCGILLSWEEYKIRDRVDSVFSFVLHDMFNVFLDSRPVRL